MKKQNIIQIISSDIVLSAKVIDLDRELSLPIPLTLHTFFMSLKVFQVKPGCLTEKEFIALIKNYNKVVEAKMMTVEAFLFFKKFFIEEPIMCSHLFDGTNTFLVYEKGALRLRYLYKSENGFISEEKKTIHYADSETFLWMLDVAQIQQTKELKGSIHKASVSLGIKM